MSRVVFIRHSLPVLTPELPPGQWSLSASGRTLATEIGQALTRLLGEEAPARVVASAEVKAIQTAELLGLGPVHVDHRLGEVAKPWYASSDDHRDAAIDYLSGQHLTAWESQDNALTRFAAAVEAVIDEHPVIVTHGTVLSLWLTQHVANLDPVDFWLGLAMPDVYVLDMASGKFERLVRR